MEHWLDSGFRQQLEPMKAHENLLAVEWGTESHEAWLRQFLRLGSFEFYSPASHDPALPLRLPDASRDLALTLNFLERIRMDQLYMVASEARRVLRPGGLWLLSGKGRAEAGWKKLLGPLFSNRQAGKPLELTHYISPEDWEIVAEDRQPAGFFSRQRLVLKRL